MNQLLHNYIQLGIATKDNMHVKKAEFATEAFLSVLITAIILTEGGNTSHAVGAIAVIHSFNVARAYEAFKQAQIEKQYPDKDP